MVVAVAGVGGYSLLGRITSATDTVTAAPATADPSDLVERSDDPADTDAAPDSDAAQVQADSDAAMDSDDTPLADSAGDGPSSTVTGESTSAGSATTTASDPVELFAGLTYSPVRVTGLEAAEAFLDLVSISDDVVLEDQGRQVVVRAKDGGVGVDQSSVLTTLSIEPMGDGFMVVDARSEAVNVTIANSGAEDPTPDQIADQTVVADGSVQLEGNVSQSGAVTITMVSTIDGSPLDGGAGLEPSVESDGRFGLTVPVTGAHRGLGGQPTHRSRHRSPVPRRTAVAGDRFNRSQQLHRGGPEPGRFRRRTGDTGCSQWNQARSDPARIHRCPSPIGSLTLRRWPDVVGGRRQRRAGRMGGIPVPCRRPEPGRGRAGGAGSRRRGRGHRRRSDIGTLESTSDGRSSLAPSSMSDRFRAYPTFEHC